MKPATGDAVARPGSYVGMDKIAITWIVAKGGALGEEWGSFYTTGPRRPSWERVGYASTCTYPIVLRGFKSMDLERHTI